MRNSEVSEVAIFKKNKEKEPAFFVSETNIKTINYKVYYMSLKEKIIYTVLAFVAGFAVGFLFYGGIGKDSVGDPTTTTYFLDILIPGIVGIIAVRLFLPSRTKELLEKRKRELNHQFRDMLDSLTTSLSSGKNVNDSFYSVYEDLKMQYEEDAFIIKEIEVILDGLRNNIDIEKTLEDFGNRSGIDDIKSFANVFRISYRKGGNIKDIIRNTHSIISDKMDITEDIETMVSSNKYEQKIMIVMPIILVGLIKLMSPEFARNFVTPTGLIATTVSIAIFVIAYFVGKAILNIKI